MHTSYFGNIKNLPKDKTISIAQGQPAWYKGRENRRLAPSWAMIKMKPEEYDRHYAIILSKLDPQEEYDAMENAVGGGAILLCWEKPGEYCHRRIVADWFKGKLGIEVTEYDKLQPILELVIEQDAEHPPTEPCPVCKKVDWYWPGDYYTGRKQRICNVCHPRPENDKAKRL